MKNVSSIKDYTHCEWCKKPRMIYYVGKYQHFYRVPTDVGSYVVCSRCKTYMQEYDKLPEMPNTYRKSRKGK